MGFTRGFALPLTIALIQTILKGKYYVVARLSNTLGKLVLMKHM